MLSSPDIVLCNQIRKSGRRYMEEFINITKPLAVNVWFDNKQMLTLSNYTGKEPSLVSVVDSIRSSKKEFNSSNLSQFQFTTNLWEE